MIYPQVLSMMNCAFPECAWPRIAHTIVLCWTTTGYWLKDKFGTWDGRQITDDQLIELNTLFDQVKVEWAIRQKEYGDLILKTSLVLDLDMSPTLSIPDDLSEEDAFHIMNVLHRAYGVEFVH